MALNKGKLKQKFIELNNKNAEENMTEEMRAMREQWAEDMADAIIEIVKMATITGTCPSGGGPLTNGKIT